VELSALAAEPIDLVCPADHHLADRAELSVRELATEPLAETPPGWGTRIVSDRLFAAAGIERVTAFEVNDIPTVLDLVRTGLACALLPRSFAVGDAELAAVPLREAPMFQTALARPAGRRLGAAATALAELIVSRSRAAPR
jgi:DNA-binding transcriptional LysR family regulator